MQQFTRSRLRRAVDELIIAEMFLVYATIESATAIGDGLSQLGRQLASGEEPGANPADALRHTLLVALESGQLGRARLALVALFPLAIGHAIHPFPGGVIIHRQPLFLGRGQVPLGQAIAAETREIHQVDILYIAATVQVFQQASEDGRLDAGGLFR